MAKDSEKEKIALSLSQFLKESPFIFLAIVFFLAIIAIFIGCAIFSLSPLGEKIGLQIVKKWEDSQESSFSNHDNVAVMNTVNKEALGKIIEMQKSLDQIQHILSSETVDKERNAICGINNADINRWELSVVAGNKYGLKLHDKVLVTNKEYNEHNPTATFFVTSESVRKLTNSPDIYMNLESAEALDIPDADIKGKFSVMIKKLDR